MLTESEFETLANRLVGIEFLYFHLMGEPTLHPLLPVLLIVVAAILLVSAILLIGSNRCVGVKILFERKAIGEKLQIDGREKIFSLPPLYISEQAYIFFSS